MKTYPVDDKIVFLVCEDVRLEPGGRATLLGTFLGGDIRIAAPKREGLNLSSLAFAFIFKDGAGSFNTRFAVITPDGKNLVPQEQTSPTTKQPTEAMTVFTKVMPFPAIQGTFYVDVFLDDRKYERTFSMAFTDGGQPT